MAIHFGNNKSYDRKKYVVPANSVYTVDFSYNPPNFYRLNNMSNVMLYCATASMPTDTLYDFKAGGLSVANFTEPVNRDKLYILNQSNTDAPILLTTWSDEFDPTFMAVSEITLNSEGTLKTDGAVKSFETELPSGNNVIGKVGLDEEALAKLDSNKLYQWCVNHLYSETGHGILENFTEYLSKIKDNTGNINFDDSCLKGVSEPKIITKYNLTTNEPFTISVDNENEYISYIEIPGNIAIEGNYNNIPIFTRDAMNAILKSEKVQNITIYGSDNPNEFPTYDIIYHINNDTEQTIFELIKQHFTATGEVTNLTGSEGRQSIFDLLYWILENTARTADSLTGDDSINVLLQDILSKLNSSNPVLSDIKEVNLTPNENEVVTCGEYEYIGEVDLSGAYKDKIIEVIISGYDVSVTHNEWDKMCHRVKAKSITLINRSSDNETLILTPQILKR